MTGNDNFVNHIFNNPDLNINKDAIMAPIMDGQVCTDVERISFAELRQQVALFQAGWKAQGFEKGDRVILIIKPCATLYILVLSLLASGMVPVFIDTGMGLKKIKMAINDANAKAIIAMHQVITKFWVIPQLWSLKRFSFDSNGFGIMPLSELLDSVKDQQHTLAISHCSESERGLISFTSGSTGRPKGADRTHQSLINQHIAIKAHLPNQQNDIDSPSFPMVVLHNLCCGITSILPKVDLAQPAAVNAAQVVKQLKEERANRMSGSPAYMSAIAQYMLVNNISLPDIKLVIVGGATVSTQLALELSDAFPNATVKIVYGSTESEPISSITANELLQSHNNKDGYLVGYPCEHIDLCLANLPPEQSSFSESELQNHLASQGHEGEILVSGPHVLKGYVDNPEATSENKIKCSDGRVWHRTGDTGSIDGQGRIWLTGRVKDKVKFGNKIHSAYLIEKEIDELFTKVTGNKDNRSAVMNFQDKSRQNDVALILSGNRNSINTCFEEIFKLLQGFNINEGKIFLLNAMPVDGRHNSKIDRPKLKQMLAQRSGQAFNLIDAE